MSYPNPQGPPYQLPPTGTQQPLPPTRQKKKPDVAKVILTSVGVLIALFILFLLIGGIIVTKPTLNSTPVAVPASTMSETFEPAEDAATEDPTVEAPELTKAPEPTLTRAQTEAIEAAESYLDFGAFSKRGLIDQLTSEYGEHFAKKDALFAVDYIHANWKAEAVEAAESYLDSGHFSKSELLDQLESPYGEDFTHDQAVYAVNKVY